MPQDLLSVEIFAVGTWNGWKFSGDDLQEIAKNTNALISGNNHHPPVKLGHEEQDFLLYPEEGVGQPALGWLENVRAVGNKLLADFKNVPDTVVEAIRQGRYRQISVEMNHIEYMGWVLTGVALLGADLPAVKTLDDLQAYLSAAASNGAALDMDALHFSIVEPAVKKPPKPAAAEPSHGKHAMSEQDKLSAEEKAELERLRQEQKAKDDQIAEFKAKEHKRQFSEAKAKALKPFEDKVKEGKLQPAIRDRIEAALDQQQTNFSEGARLHVPTELLEVVMNSETLPNGESATNDTGDAERQRIAGDPTAAFAQECERIMVTKKLSYSEAQRMVRYEKPEVFAAYTGFLTKHVEVA